MLKTVVIIPSRLHAERLPNKPLAEINGLPMIVHVMERAKESKVGDVIVATPDNEILKVVEENNGNVFLTKDEHKTGSDRIFEVFKSEYKNKANIIINLQGDMPNIKPDSIAKLNKFMKSENCDIGTLASEIKNQDELNNPNIVKVALEKTLDDDNFLEAKDFFRKNNVLKDKKVYHHIGCYAFTNQSISKYVALPRTKKEIERNLEQMRALENKMSIKVGLCKSLPLGVDTIEDLEKIKKEMK